MQILIDKNFHYSNYGSMSYFELMHKIQHDYAGKWITVDTSRLYKDCYYIKELDTCISDSNVIRVIDDERNNNVFECPECGFQGTKEELLQHKAENKLKIKHCKDCQFFKFRMVGDSKYDSFKERVNITDDSFTEIETSRRIYNYKKKCTYNYDGLTCKFEQCANAELINPFKDSYFVNNPYGNLFAGYNPFNGYIKGDIYHTKSGTYDITFDMNSYEFVAKNSRTTYKTVLKVRNEYGNTWIEADKGPFPSKTLENIVRNIRYKISDLVHDIDRFNRRVSEDWRYSNPDGSIMQSAIVNGILKERPKPLNWKILELL